MNQNHTYKYSGSIELELGQKLKSVEISFCTYGTIDTNCSNVIWVCHALTANADASDWWHTIFGPGKVLDPAKYFIVCANNLGSCYGTIAELESKTPNKNGLDQLLEVTIRDMVEVHRILAKHLKIENIQLLIGGSQGAQQCMEWAIVEPHFISNMVLLATSAKHSAWGIAFNEAQRMAIGAGESGLRAARAIAMLSYRNYEMFERTASNDSGQIGDYGAIGYQQHQGLKLENRFDPQSYVILSKAMDSHDVGRNRGGVVNALNLVKARTLIIGISSDILFPVKEQVYLSELIPESELVIIDSPYGHDGFLTEGESINECILKFLN